MVVGFNAMMKVQARTMVALAVVSIRPLAVMAAVAPISVSVSVVSIVATTVRAVVVPVVSAVVVVGAGTDMDIDITGVRAASREDPEDATLGAPGKLLGVLLPVIAVDSGLAHLMHPRTTGGLVARQRAAHLDEPAVDGRGLAEIAAVGPLRWLRAKEDV